MLKNNKGFTVIELIMSFLFSSILAVSLFSVIVSYRNKQVDSSVETDILAFKSQLIMDIQEDIQLKGLKYIDYCYYDDDNNPSTPVVLQPRCVNIHFNGNPETVKMFYVAFDYGEDIVENPNGTTQAFPYEMPYIVYGDIRYTIPDAANVYIDDDYILTQTKPTDGIEAGTTLYKVHFNLKHSDLDTNVNISIVASGSMHTDTSSGPYKAYNIGDIVYIQVNDHEQKQFRVIQYSNTYKDDLTLLYDDVYDTSSDCNTTYVCDSINYGVIDNVSNRYNSSVIKTKVNKIENVWNNVDLVRLITVDEVSRISALCPLYKGANSPEISLGNNSSLNWLTNKSYWTMSEKELTGNDNGKKVWYVKGPSKTLSFDYVNINHTLRPVVVVKKIFVTNIH